MSARWTAVIAAAAVSAVPACATRGPAAPRTDAAATASALEAEYLAARFRRFPEEATVLGIPGADDAAVTDVRPAAVRAWQSFEDGLLARARAVDRPALTGRPEGIALGILSEALEGDAARRPCRDELWSVSSIAGWQGAYAQLAELQPVGTPAQRRAAVARVGALARRVDDERANLAEGVRLGYVATRANVDRVVGELDQLLATPAADSPFTGPGRRSGDAAFAAELAAAVERDLAPAARRYREFLAGEYRARARTLPDLRSFPAGEACYRGALREATTLDLDARAVHGTGLAEMARIHGEMARIGARSFGTSDVPALLRRMREDPALRFRSSAEIVAAARAAVDRALAAAPRAFGRLPRAPVRIVEYPAFRREAEPADSYTPSFAGGKLEGIFFINAFSPADKPRAFTESTTFHETVPGHHLQGALALEGDGPRIGRYVVNSGFVEGWALYAERLAGELGLYATDLDRLGQLANEALRAARLVVDPGLAVLGWDRQRAIDYLVEDAGVDPATAASEVDRYAAWPGQATAYLTGSLEIQRLRAGAERALGPRFDLRAFHDAVLSDGNVTLPLLRERIARFVREAQRPGA